MQRRVFIAWSIALGLVWLLANWPKSFGLGNVFRSAGFPLEFEFWVAGRLQLFDTGALAIDLTLGVVFVVGLAWLCAWSRRKGDDRGATADRPRE
jgi:hypothetical protein